MNNINELDNLIYKNGVKRTKTIYEKLKKNENELFDQ